VLSSLAIPLEHCQPLSGRRCCNQPTRLRKVEDVFRCLKKENYQKKERSIKKLDKKLKDCESAIPRDSKHIPGSQRRPPDYFPLSE